MTSTKPKGWPENLIYVTRNVYSKQFNTEKLDQLGVKKNINSPCQNPVKHVKIKTITDPGHPARGENGLFAAIKLSPKSHVIDYLGYVHPEEESDPNSDYDLSLDRDIGVGIDAQKYGTEARMINDYRGIQNRPNVYFENRRVDGELRMSIFVMDKPIQKGEELCINYGKGFWKARDATN